MRTAVAFLLSLIIFQAQAEVPRNGFTEEENQKMANANAQAAFFDRHFPTLFKNDSPLSLELLDTSDAKPFAEYEETGYLIFSYNFAFRSRQAKLTMAGNLPEGVQLVIFTDSPSEKEALEIKKDFSSVIAEDRVTVVYMPRAAGGFWARDSVPVPVFRSPKEEEASEKFTVVDARYSRFEEDKRFGDLFHADVTKTNYFFEGGNFMANAQNECLVVNKTATAQIPDSVFRSHYGCQQLVRLPHVKGIGHADESVKFINDNTVVTDEASYVSILENKGYNVIQLPRPFRRYETYVNSLLINGTLFVPIFNQAGDEAALQVYRDAGFEKVIGINSEVLSNEGLGSLHCITMTYPPVEMNRLLNSLGGSVLQ